MGAQRLIEQFVGEGVGRRRGHRSEPIQVEGRDRARVVCRVARADGDLSETERETILQHARAAGVESLVAAEIARPTPLARIVEGIDDLQHRADLYVLAFGIVRGDEKVSGAERIYLAQLASLLGIEPEKAEQLEREAGTRIDQTQ